MLDYLLGFMIRNWWSLLVVSTFFFIFIVMFVSCVNAITWILGVK